MDIVVQTPRIPHSGENLHARDLITITGGKGANAAVALTRQQARPNSFTNVGADRLWPGRAGNLAGARWTPPRWGQVPDAGTGAAVLPGGA